MSSNPQTYLRVPSHLVWFAVTSTRRRFSRSRKVRLAPQLNIGNKLPNPVRGPGLQEADLMLEKTFRLAEQVRLQFGAEALKVSDTPPPKRSQRKFRLRRFRDDH